MKIYAGGDPECDSSLPNRFHSDCEQYVSRPYGVRQCWRHRSHQSHEQSGHCRHYSLVSRVKHSTQINMTFL